MDGKKLEYLHCPEVNLVLSVCSLFLYIGQCVDVSTRFEAQAT